tara:strand:+ start:513 stop:722 length:210 start_codon:yes stop_codon:yes gene_type:complete
MNKEVDEIRGRLRKRREDLKNPIKIKNEIKITEINLSFNNILVLTAKFALASILIGLSLYIITFPFWIF